MQTTTKLNQLNGEQQRAARHLLGLCLVSACLMLAWTGFKQAAKVLPIENYAPVSVEGNHAPCDLTHDMNYKGMVLLYTTRKGMNALPF